MPDGLDLGIAVADLRHALDPVGFATERLAFHPDPWQATVLRAQGRQLLLNCSRQAGKSTTTAVLACHTALYRPDSLTLLVSPSLRQSGELFRKVTGFLKLLDPPPRLVEDNRLSATLQTGSRIVSLPSGESTIRGFSAPDLVIEDEASRVDDALYRAIRPMLATSEGRLILMSTPFGKRGHFYEAWTHGGEAWERIQITATECPRISPAFLARERAELGEVWFRQEYLCSFLDTVDAVFRTEDIERAFSDDVEPLFGDAGDVIRPLFG
jgi:hypothetical protein